jgi:hypothetical protein
MTDTLDLDNGVMICGEQIRICKTLEAQLRRLAAQHGHTFGPIRTLDDYVLALLCTVSDEDNAAMLALVEEFEATQHLEENDRHE